MDGSLADSPRPSNLQPTNGSERPAPRRDQVALDVEEIKRSISILDVLSRYQVAVLGSGLSRRARCPFHDDHVPSLGIYLNTDRYYCFACGANGDVISLVRRLEGVSFREALRRLADIAPAAGQFASQIARLAFPKPPAQHDQRLIWQQAIQSARPAREPSGANAGFDADEALVPALLAAASALYQDALLHTPRALAYLLARGITRATAIEARLGFAEGTTLRRFIGHDPALLRCAVQVGLLDGWGRERLRDRLVMPAFRGGHCIWMIGRLLRDGDEQAVASGHGAQSQPPAAALGGRDGSTGGVTRRIRSPRYLGLTLPKPLLGLGLVPDRISVREALRGVLVVEGVFDLLTVRAWRLPIACIALVGTHLRHDQLHELRALAGGGPVWLGLDADEAGDKAAERLRDQLVAAGCPADFVRRLRPPGGAKDLSDIAHDAHARELVLAALAAGNGLVLNTRGSTPSSGAHTQ